MASRRDVLRAIAGVGGASGLYVAARSLGLIEGEEAWAGAPDLAPGSGRGAHVIILGAGMAGLSAAYELGLAGYRCTLLEARKRTGGRNWTLRGGDAVELDNAPRQVCGFGEGHYFNAGPARIPSHHDATLGYCRELGVPMEVLVNHSESALIQAQGLNGEAPIQLRQAIYDTRGHIADIMAKAIRGGGLDKTFSTGDREKLLAGVVAYGGLTPQGAQALARRAREPSAPTSVTGALAYNGSTASGFVTPPGAGRQVAIARKPLPLETCSHPFVGVAATFHENIDMQATMFQPKGGMDAIPRALERTLAPGVLHTGCEVTRIARTPAGVAVEYREGGRPRRVEAAYAVITLPLCVLQSIPNDLSADRKSVVAGAHYASAMKVAFQAPRFWETRSQIYGGLSFTDRDTFITWYPSYDLMSAEGVLVAGYSFGEQADRFSALPLSERFAYARATVERLHPGQSAAMRAPITVSWKDVPFNHGIECALAEQNPAGYDLLSEPDGPFYFAGEHLSHVGAWQQGAIVSAHRVVRMLDARHRGGREVADSRPS